MSKAAPTKPASLMVKRSIRFNPCHLLNITLHANLTMIVTLITHPTCRPLVNFLNSDFFIIR